MNTRQAFERARKAAKNSTFYKCHTGCVAIYGGKVIACGWNMDKTHSLQTEYNKYRGFDELSYPGTIHAEMMVIRKIRYLDIDFSRVKIYVARWGENSPKMSKPCAACEHALRDLGIKRVYYTGDNSYVYERYV